MRALGVMALLLLALFLASCTNDPQSTLIQKGEHNEKIWSVYNILWVGAAVVFVLVEGLLVYTIFRYRRVPRTAHGRPVPVHGNTKLEVIWTIIPAVVLVIIAVPTLSTIAALADRPDDPDTVKVTVVGHQFFFEFLYPDLGIRSLNTLHIPEDTMVDIELQSEDVIHSFWVPQLAGKTDNIPGRTNHMWLEANDPGTYQGQCAEFCGLGHARMRFTVEVHAGGDFQAWVQQQQNPQSAEGDPAVGEQLVVGGPCAGCHTIEGTSAQGTTGPALTGFADRPQIAGVLENTPENLATWLSDPPSVKPGTLMPKLPLSEADIKNIVAYLMTLTENQ